MSSCIETNAVNTTHMLLPYQAGYSESKGYEEIHSYYYPRGPIKRILSFFRTAGGLPMYSGNTEYYEFDQIARDILGRSSFGSAIQSTIFGGGKGFELHSMVASSLGEIIERAIGSLVNFDYDNKVHFGTYEELKAKGYNCIEPKEFPLFAKQQYGKKGLAYHPFDKDVFLGWIEGERLLQSSDSIWVPAQLSLPFYLAHPREKLLGYATSGGLSAHVSRELAIYHGLSEVLERDAVNVHWNCGHPPKQIDIDCEPNDHRTRKVLNHAASTVDNIRLYLHPTEFKGFHTVTAIGFIKGFSSWSYLAGGGGGFDINEAILSALGELVQAENSCRIQLYCPEWGYSDRVRELFGVEENTPVEKFDIFYKVVGHYGYPSNARKLDWYLNGPEVEKLSELQNAPNDKGSNYDRMMELVEKYDLDPIFFDFTLPSFKDVCLTKVICTKLTPPYLHSLPLLGADRYRTLPKELGWTDRELKYEDLTRDPQPYP